MERRQYFRINDTLGFSYRLIGDSKKEDTFWSSLAAMDEQINQLLGALANTQPQLTKLLGLMNQKLERIASQLMLDGELMQKMASRVGEVNISACGMGFSHPQTVAPRSQIALKLHLLPSETKVAAEGRVVDCALQAEGLYYWRIKFTRMAEAERDLLIRHLIERQRQQIKESKSQNDIL
jgi:c-di-GMP-binding flagellar brake protein YcgR